MYKVFMFMSFQKKKEACCIDTLYSSGLVYDTALNKNLQMASHRLLPILHTQGMRQTEWSGEENY